MSFVIERFTHPEWLSNAWLIADPAGEALLVDTGVSAGPVLEHVRRSGVRVRWIVNTHHHYDHVAANAELSSALRAPVAAHEWEAERVTPAPDRTLGEGDVLTSGALRARVLHIPGHTQGQIALVVEIADDGRTSPSPAPDPLVATGDTLFRRSIGGCVGPGHGTFAQLRASLLDRLLTLARETVVLPGHGETSRIGEELEENPFIRLFRGLDPPGDAPCRFAGRPARLLLSARDYDGGTKAVVRFPDGSEAVVPGSRLTLESGGP